MGNFLVRLHNEMEKAAHDYIKKYQFDDIGYGVSKQRAIDDFLAGAKWGMYYEHKQKRESNGKARHGAQRKV